MRKRNKKRKVTIHHFFLFALIGLGIAYIVAMATYTEAENMFFNDEQLEEIVEFHAKSSTVDEDVICPVVLDTPVGETVTFTTVFEKEYPISNAIMLRSSFQCIKVYLNDVCVLDYGEEQKTFNQIIPASAWHVIRPKTMILPGDVLKVELICSIDPYQGLFRGIYIGPKVSMLYMIINNARMSLVVAIPLFILGILYIVICGIFPERLSRRKLCIIGSLSAMSSVWILLESQIIQLVWGILPVSYTLLFVLFSLLPILICELLLQYKLFQNSLSTKIAFYITVICFLVFHGLQIFAGYQYVNSVWIIHCAFLAEIIAFLIEGIRRIKGTRYRDDKDIIIAGVVFAIFGLIDIINKYIFKEIMDDVVFVKVGIFAFMLLIGYYTLKRAVNDHEISMEQEFWKQVAHTDALTKLGNRLRFEERKKEIRKADTKTSLTVLMIDINDLKIINDEYGHEMGDVAIATVGQVILDTFDAYGEGFRIGGDEFCLFLTLLNKEQAIKKSQECEKKLTEFSREYEISLRIAMGVSEMKDIGIDAAISIADAEMYKNKELNKLKQKRMEMR
jgi:diguanylate cyclase (GGDEF)-like protein